MEIQAGNGDRYSSVLFWQVCCAVCQPPAANTPCLQRTLLNMATGLLVQKLVPLAMKTLWDHSSNPSKLPCPFLAAWEVAGGVGGFLEQAWLPVLGYGATGGAQLHGLTLRVFKHGLGDGWLQVLQADLLPVLAGTPQSQCHIVDLLPSCIAAQE